ncbi:MAG: FliI/YscN family ATPase [Planctomycetota bacterium]
MRGEIDLARLRSRLAEVPLPRARGRIHAVVGVTIEAVGLKTRLGEVCLLHGIPDRFAAVAIVVGFHGETTCLMPVDDLRGLGPGTEVEPTGRSLSVAASPALLGRVLDALGRPIDGGPPLAALEPIPIHRDSPPPLSRPMIRHPLFTGVRSLDALLTVGKGQRLGIFSGSGVGKSTLLGMIARNALSDINIIALVGERGREVRHFLEEVLGRDGLARSVVVVATSDTPPVRRYLGALTATALAEYFRDQGRDVLFVMDSVTRFAAAQREIGLALGEPPTTKGYPPSTFALLPRLVERLGPSPKGSITGMFTVLVEGDDLADPIADTMRSLLDGHVVLSREIANRGHYPPVDLLHSVSRVMPHITTEPHLQDAIRFRELYAAYEQNRDLVEVGAYKAGTNPTLDRALERLPAMLHFLRQPAQTRAEPASTLAALAQAISEARP